MAWELGAGLGHTIPLAAIGDQLLLNGHRVDYALRNPKTARSAKIGPDADIYPAPFLGPLPGLNRAAIDCAEMLLIRGFDITNRLDRCLSNWFRIFESCHPDAIVTDHAPSARLAAYVSGIPSFAIGNGFAIPPLTIPLQPFSSSADPGTNERNVFERKLNAITNGTLKRHHCREIDRAAELYFGGSTYLTTFAELDNYERREKSVFYGPVYRQTDSATKGEQHRTKSRVFVYLYPDAPILPRILAALDRLSIATVVYAGGRAISGFDADKFESIQLTQQSLALGTEPSPYDLVICQGGGNTVATALLQGIPVLIFPRHIEQSMVGARLKEQGLAELFTSQLDSIAIEDFLENCLNNECLRNRAQAFKNKYEDFDGKAVARAIAESIVGGA